MFDIKRSEIKALSVKWFGNDSEENQTKILLMIATTRCARISYVIPNSNQEIDYGADLKLHDRLTSSGHMSAFEHCARAMIWKEYCTYVQGRLIFDENDHIITPENTARGWCGNFRGFIQYRKMFENENRSDPRLIKK